MCLDRGGPTRHAEENMRHSPLFAPRRCLSLIAALLASASPLVETHAQGPGLFDAFAARRESRHDPLFTGLAFAGYSGMFGLRVSGALDFNNGGNGSVAGPQPVPYYGCDRFR